MRAARIFGITAVTVAGVAAAVVAGLTTSSCGSTPPNVQVRSFEQARNVDYLCIAYNNPDGGGPLAPTENVGLNANQCSVVPPNGDGTDLPNHLLALVTQAARGEVAVVDLTATPNGNLGAIVDNSHVAPGTNFIPVGSQPTGIVVAPDAKMTFVASADVNKPAIYGLPTSGRKVGTDGKKDVVVGGILGDSTQFPQAATSAFFTNLVVSPPTLTDLPACALPQPPQTISVARITPEQGGPPSGYVIVATLQQAQGTPAAVVTIDPTGLLRGVDIDVGSGDAGAAGLDGGDAGVAAGDAALDGGAAAVDAGEAGAQGATAPTVTPGVLAACPILGAVRLADVTASGPVAWAPGPAWADGVPYADAGDLSSTEPSIGSGAACPMPSPIPPLTTPPGVQPYPAHAVMRDDAPLLYVADSLLPEVHVIDVTDPAHPVEQPPLLATSVAQPTRQVTVGDIALSPITRQYQRFLYAVDLSDGSVMVFDVTDPATSPRVPLLRPHPELNPLSAPDRLSFASPVAALAFATHDWPIIPPAADGTMSNDQVHAYSGLLCNPNPNVLVPDGGAGSAGDAGVLDYGYYYTAQTTGVPYTNGTVQQMPLRLRGVFAFVTLSTGQVVTIDVDDWDAPCRRPDPMAIDAGAHYGMTGVLDIPEPLAGPPGSPTFLDPYAAPFAPGDPTQPSWVTQEAFFPVSAPHRMRSMFLLRNDPVVGNNAPNVVSTPSLTDVSGTTVSTAAGGVSALILPTALPDGFIDPSLVLDPTDPPMTQRIEADASVLPATSSVLPGVRLSFDDPTVSQAQVWAVTYEGVVPTLNSITADILTPDADGGPGAGYRSLTFTIGQGLPGADAGAPLPGIGPGFCERGVEDWDLGQQRAAQALAEMSARGLPPPPDLKDWTGDYIEIVDDPVPQGDPYWNVQNSCWDGLKSGTTDLSPGPAVKLPDGGTMDKQSIADARYTACNQAFGTGSPDTYLARDLPIVRAYDDHLDVGRFYWENDGGKGEPPEPERTTNRKILGADPSNEKALRFIACCFHNQATFKVRTGGEWVATGQGSGFLHHVVAAPSPGETDPLSGGPGSLRCIQSCNPQNVLLSSRSIDVPWGPIPWGTSTARGDAGAGEPTDAGKGMLDGGADGGSAGLNCTYPAGAGVIDRNSALAMRNPFFSYVTWMACVAPRSPLDHTVTLRDDTWHFQVGGGFAPLTASLTSNTLLDVSPQSMRYIQPLGWMAIIDGQSQGLEIIDLNSPAIVAHSYF